MIEFHSRYYNSKPFPPIPEWIEKQVLAPGTIAHENWINPFDQTYSDRELIKKDGSIELSQAFKLYKVSEEIWEWVRKNISADITNCNIASNGFDDRPTSGPHTDRSRNFTLLYLFDSGGKDVETSFWQEQGQPLMRPRGTVSDDFNRLVKLDSVIIPERHWMLLDARVLHSIEGIVGRRTAFQVSLDHEI